MKSRVMSTICLKSESPEDTRKLASELAPHARPGDIYCLEGFLAVGKTVFAQGFARGLGITEHITSPSFPIIQEYEHQPPFYHMDFYRLSSPEDILDMGADEFFLGSGISLIEWPDRAEGLFPVDVIRIHIDIGSMGERNIDISASEKRMREIERALF